MKINATIWENNVSIYINSHKNVHPFDPVIPLPGIYPKEIIQNNNNNNKNPTSILMFIASLQ
jgi:hypothetical protein